MDSQLVSQMQQTFLIANSTSVNGAGELVYGASTSARGRGTEKVVYIRNAHGEKLMSSRQIVFPSSVDVRINSRVYWPGETTSGDVGWVPVGLALRVGEAGSSDHWKVWFGGVGGDGSAG